MNNYKNEYDNKILKDIREKTFSIICKENLSETIYLEQDKKQKIKYLNI